MFAPSSTCFCTIMDIPQRYRTALAFTSLWMLVPIVLGDKLRELLLCVCIASLLYWSMPNATTLIIDRSLVATFAINLLLYSVAQYNFYVSLLLLPIIMCYAFANFMYEKKYYKLHFIAHLLFRYLFYWWSFRVMVGHMRYFELQTALYIVQATCIDFYVKYKV